VRSDIPLNEMSDETPVAGSIFCSLWYTFGSIESNCQTTALLLTEAESLLLFEAAGSASCQMARVLVFSCRTFIGDKLVHCIGSVIAVEILETIPEFSSSWMEHTNESL